MIYIREDLRNEAGHRRRVTILSLYMFGILSVLAKISGDLKSGVPNSGDLNLLRYFLEEAKEARYNSTRIFDTKKEKLGAAVFHDYTRSIP